MADFPFPYLEHGELSLESFTKAGGAYIAFQKPIAKKDRPAIRRGCPEAIGGMWAWGPNLVSCESMGDVFDYTVGEVYAGGDRDSIDEAVAAKFAADVEKWIKGVHAKFPIAFFLGPCHAAEPSPWGQWSAQVIPGIMVPFLEKFADDNAKVLADETEMGMDYDPEEGVFDGVAMSCILQHVPEGSDFEQRAEALRERFPL